MAAVYNNAFLVVGASCARESMQGFIESTWSIAENFRVTTVENDNGTISEIHTQPHEYHGNFCDPSTSNRNDFGSKRNQGPLASRGWTLQEQILATRMIHFERDGLFCKCRASNQCERIEHTDADTT
jgi:hypothetical protein